MEELRPARAATDIRTSYDAPRDRDVTVIVPARWALGVALDVNGGSSDWERLVPPMVGPRG